MGQQSALRSVSCGILPICSCRSMPAAYLLIAVLFLAARAVVVVTAAAPRVNRVAPAFRAVRRRIRDHGSTFPWFRYGAESAEAVDDKQGAAREVHPAARVPGHRLAAVTAGEC